jgi:drug/metabolite transporter (DMT)-like permease
VDRLVTSERSARICAALAAGVIAWSSIFIELSRVSGSTAAFFRCLYALPVLLPLVWWEDRRFGSRSLRQRLPALLGGIFFGVDLVFWGQAIGDVGAGLATVLANIQVVVMPLTAWVIFSEKPSGRILYAIPIAVAGVILISGVFESGAYGRDPTTGAVFGVAGGLAYVGALLCLRHGGGDLRRPGGPLIDLTLTGMVTSAVMGLVWGNINFIPVFPGAWWLIMLALSSQVVGWLMLTMSLPRLPAALTSLLLMIQAAGSLILGAIIFDAIPSALQIAGVVLLLGAVIYGTRPGRTDELDVVGVIAVGDSEQCPDDPEGSRAGSVHAR